MFGVSDEIPDVTRSSGGTDLYMGNPVLVAEKVSGIIGCVPRVPKGPGDPSALGFAPLPSWRCLGPWWGRTSPPGAGPLPTSAHGALRDGWPHPVNPRDPSGGPGTIPGDPETFPMAETSLPIYNYLPPDHSGTPRDVRDLIRDSEQHSVTAYILSL